MAQWMGLDDLDVCDSVIWDEGWVRTIDLGEWAGSETGCSLQKEGRGRNGGSS